MRSNNSVMASYAALVLAFLPLFAAQTIQPSNDPLPSQANPLQLSWTYGSSGGVSATAVLTPLDPRIGLGQTLASLNSISIKGTIKLADPHVQNSVSSITSANIAYISCDPNDNSSNVTPTQILNQVIGIQPQVQAVILFSVTASRCSISSPFSYGSILSMTTQDDARMLKNIIESNNAAPSATIVDQAVASGSNGSNANQTPAPTTAVAMSILYSITGIITLLFLVIIATGAIRAHRHPERYGPRGGFPGRPRQSRAKGLARAMLETLPIVKFGDPEPAKPGSQDVELEEGVAREHNATTENSNPSANSVEGAAQTEQNGPEEAAEAGIGPNTQTTEGPSTETHHHDDNHLGCSICTEDFEKGEDVRVLPCNHKFHPACIDPWLLNVSGTCPLCRVDLRPVETHISENNEEGTSEGVEGEAREAGEATTAPPLTEAEGADASANPPRGRVSRRIDAALLRNAPAHERIAVLRQMRQQQIESDAAPGAEADREELSRRARLTARFKDVFRIRTRAATEPANAAEASTNAATASSTVAPAEERRGLEETL